MGPGFPVPSRSLKASSLPEPAAFPIVHGTVSDEPIIDLHSDQYFMGEALRQAHKAWEREEVPVGAVIVHNGRIIARAHNQVEMLKDATAHAEMLAITQAESVLGDWRLNECDVYITKEPCPMCGGVVDLLQHPKLNHQCEVVRGVREVECAEMLRAFFRERRDENAGR
jgi:tRNA(adenine34) deaminase